MVIMNISWKENDYENGHDYYEHLSEGNINSCPLYSKGLLLWHIDSRPQATGFSPRLIV